MKDEVLGYHELDVRVPFGWVDRYEYLWHGHALSFFEQARADLVRPFELSAARFLELELAVPMIDLQVEYRAPARDDEALAVQCSLVRPALPMPHLIFVYRIVRREGGQEVLRGRTRQIITRRTGQVLIRIPAQVRERQAQVWGYLAGRPRWEP